MRSCPFVLAVLFLNCIYGQTSNFGHRPHLDSIEPLQPLSGKVNYRIGKDPSKWRTDIPTYGRIAHHGVYAGVDLVFYGTQGQLDDGCLILDTAAGPVRLVARTTAIPQHVAGGRNAARGIDAERRARTGGGQRGDRAGRSFRRHQRFRLRRHEFSNRCERIFRSIGANG